MAGKILIVSDKRDAFFDLSDLIPEMVEVEGVTEEWAIDYFMKGLEGSRYMKFPSHTPNNVLVEWIMHGNWNVKSGVE